MAEAEKAVVNLRELEAAMYAAEPETPAGGLGGFTMEATSEEVWWCGVWVVVCFSSSPDIVVIGAEVSSSPYLFPFVFCFFCR